MFTQFKSLLTRFHRDERGVFMVIFGILALVLIATSGAVVDYTSIEQTRTRAQSALDAAALGLQPHVFDTTGTWNEAKFMSAASSLLKERLGDASVASGVTGATINSRNGQLILNGFIDVPTSFVALVGVPKVRARVVSEATRKRLNLEVAMVLDNSGSMSSYSRMTELKKAAKNATDILFDNQDTQPNVFVSIVPFTQFVNVGTANRTASWMSQSGASSISHLNFDDDDNDATPFTATVDRWKLYNEFGSGSWKGCVEARVTPFDTDDTVPNNALPDTMFQPVFAPDSSVDNYLSDTGGSCTRVPPTWTMTETKTKCPYKVSGNSATNYDNCSKAVTATRAGTDVYGANVSSPPSSQPADNSVYSYYNDSSCTISYTGSGSSSNNYTNKKITSCTYDFSTKEYQERLCKYTGKSGNSANSDCPATAILPLVNVRQTVKDRIDAMVASGSTNIEQGSIWGFRTLSPTEPFTEGREYDEATSKIMIVMTDGENNPNYSTYSSNVYGNSSWTAWGYRINKRLLTESTTPKDSTASSSQVIAEVNRRTVLACGSAKAKGVIVYTIGLSSPNNTTTQMLKDCATPSKTENGVTTNYWYFPNNSSELTTVFQDIAEQLSELRLAQ